MNKRMFQILDEMNVDDAKNNTSLVKIATTFISADKVKKGAKISMGADEHTLFQIANEEVIPVLLIVNKEEYFKRKDGKL